MKYNLKNPLWETNPKKAKEGLEKELKEIRTEQSKKRTIPHGWRYSWVNGEWLIKELLGE